MWRRDLKAIKEGFAEKVTFELGFKGWGGVHQLDNMEKAVEGKAEMNEPMKELMEKTA